MILAQVPSKEYTAQARTFVYPQRLDPAWTRCKITLTREGWPAIDPLVDIGVEISLDDGDTWQLVLSTPVNGTAPLNRQGLPETIAGVAGSLPGVGNPNRRLRGAVENFATMTTAVQVEAT